MAHYGSEHSQRHRGLLHHNISMVRAEPYESMLEMWSTESRAPDIAPTINFPIRMYKLISHPTLARKELHLVPDDEFF